MGLAEMHHRARQKKPGNQPGGAAGDATGTHSTSPATTEPSRTRGVLDGRHPLKTPRVDDGTGHPAFSARARRPRWYSVRPGFLRSAAVVVACTVGSGSGVAPAMASSASRTKA